MRLCLLAASLPLFAACAPPADDGKVAGDDTAGDTGAPPAVDTDWGVATDCAVPADGGFDAFYGDGTAVLVYGDDPREAALAEWVTEVYAPWITLTPRAYADLTEDDRARNLLVFGSLATNPLLGELNGSLPAWFEATSFVFGGHRYEEHGNGVALIHPSPFADGRWLTVYAGNSYEGAFSTFTVSSGGYDYETTRGRGTLLQEGDLCRDGERWGYYDNARFVNADEWPTWQGWLDELDETTTEHHVFRYLPDSYAAANVDWGSSQQETRYDAVLAALGVDALDEPIVTYLYPDNATKQAVTGNGGNAAANDLNYENHIVFGEDVDAFTIHEDVHVIAWYRIGATSYALLGEGLAVAMEGEWAGAPLAEWAADFAREGTLPSLTDLEEGWSGIDPDISYPVAGAFVQWLSDEWGIETVESLYVRDDLDAGFEAELGMSHDEVEAAWLSTLR